MLSPLLLMFSALIACSDKGDEIPTTTDVTVTVTSVDQALTGYVDNEFIDGWDVTFDHWITVFNEVSIGGASTGPTPYIVDWTLLTEPAELRTFQLGSGTHAVGAQTVAAVPEMQALTEIDEDIRATMVERGLTHWIQGYAENGGELVTFAWGLENLTYSANCEDGSLEEPAEEPGIAITDEEVEEQTAQSAELKFHLDHLFFDKEETEDANLRFEVFYVWRDVNTYEIHWDDLSEVISAGLFDRDNKPIEDENERQLSYSNAGLPLTEYLLYSLEGMIHLNGTGLCEHNDL